LPEWDNVRHALAAIAIRGLKDITPRHRVGVWPCSFPEVGIYLGINVISMDITEKLVFNRPRHYLVGGNGEDSEDSTYTKA